MILGRQVVWVGEYLGDAKRPICHNTVLSSYLSLLRLEDMDIAGQPVEPRCEPAKPPNSYHPTVIQNTRRITRRPNGQGTIQGHELRAWKEMQRDSK